MLTLLSISGPRDQRSVFATFDPIQSTWLVSDLRSKLDLNRGLLESREFVPAECVMRASELWKILISRLRPDLQIVSKEFAVTLISQKLAASGLDWVRAPGAAPAAYDYMTQLMPVLAHPQGEEMMQEWFADNPASHARWGRWFDLSLTLWREFLDEGFIAPPWASGVLVNEDSMGDAWGKPLVVDLGAELDQVEADLFVELSKFVDVTVLRPEPEWAGDYKKALVAYDIFERRMKVEKAKVESGEAFPAPRCEYRKYTTMIAEVKDAVSTARIWLDKGVAKPSDIAIVAADIECYWPALSSYLETEGIPCQKDHVRRLHGYPDISRWMAHMRLRTGSFAEADVELALFEPFGSSGRAITYERFKMLYSTLYCRDDLSRAESVARRFAIELDAEDEAVRDDFVGWTLKQLPEEMELQRVESIYKRLFSECPQATRLSVKRWLTYFEQLAAKVECRIKDGDPDGLACINLSSAESSPATHMIVLGLSEAALKSGGGTSIVSSDINDLAYQFGFHLSSEEQACLEFEARWMISGSERELLLSVPETDFNGSPQAASWLWVRGAREQGTHENLSIPLPTRWDQLQRASLTTIASEHKWSAAHLAFLERSMKEDLGLETPEPFGQGLIEVLSPSAIEDYLDCPFVFASKRLFALSDMAELDLEIDAARRGSLMHALFEALTVEPVKFDLTQEDLGAVVEKARERSGLELADQRLWPSLKARMVDLGRRFLEFEREYRRSFPDARVLSRESDLAGHLIPSTGELSIQPPDNGEQSFRFVGRVDRIDTDSENNVAIYDYKSSTFGTGQFTSWIKNNQIQLLLYAMATENGLTGHNPRQVLAALYYTAKPLGRDYGFKVEDVEQGLYDTSDKRKRNRITHQAKLDLFSEGQALVQKAAAGILAGDFRAKPKDKNQCKTCQWSALCRAPHLSL